MHTFLQALNTADDDLSNALKAITNIRNLPEQVRPHRGDWGTWTGDQQ